MGLVSSRDQAGKAQEMRFFCYFFFFLPDGKDLKVVEGELTKKKKKESDEIKMVTSFS